MTKQEILAELCEKFPLLYRVRSFGTLDIDCVSGEVESWLSQALDKYGAMEYERGYDKGYREACKRFPDPDQEN